MMRNNYFIIFLLLTSLIFFTETFAETEKPDASDDKDQVQSEENIESRIHHVEDTLQKFSDEHKSVIQRVEDKLQKYSDENKSVSADFKRHADTIGWIIGVIATILSVITVIIAIATFSVTIAVPHYYQITNGLKQAKKKLEIQQQLDVLMARIQLDIVQQLSECFSEIPTNDPDYVDSSKLVLGAFEQAFQIQSILQEIQSGRKNVDVVNLCGVLQQLSGRDTKKTWTKDIREYLYLLLSGEFLADDIAKQAIKNLLRDL